MHWSDALHRHRLPRDLRDRLAEAPSPQDARHRVTHVVHWLHLVTPLAQRHDLVEVTAHCAELASEATGLASPRSRAAVAQARHWVAAMRHQDLGAVTLAAAQCQAPGGPPVHQPSAEPPPLSQVEEAALSAVRVAVHHLRHTLVAGLNAERALRALPEAERSRHQRALLQAVRDHAYQGRVLKQGELARTPPSLQVCYDRVATRFPHIEVDAVGLLQADVLRRHFQQRLGFAVSPRDPEPWRGAPIDVDILVLKGIALRLVASGHPPGAWPWVFGLIDQARLERESGPPKAS